MKVPLKQFIFRILGRGGAPTHVEPNLHWREKAGPQQPESAREPMPPRLQIRGVMEIDLPHISAIQGSSSEASQWLPADYLAFDCEVAILDGQVAGFVVSRQVADEEREILNVAVHADFRRVGIATALLRHQMARWPGAHFLEVRESNFSARRLYERLGFEATGTRPGYYEHPPETGIVMRVFS